MTTTIATAAAIDTAACARIDGFGGKRVGMCTDRQDLGPTAKAGLWGSAKPTGWGGLNRGAVSAVGDVRCCAVRMTRR